MTSPGGKPAFAAPAHTYLLLGIGIILHTSVVLTTRVPPWRPCTAQVSIQRGGFPAETLQALRYLLASGPEAAAGRWCALLGG